MERDVTPALRHPIAWLDEKLGAHKRRRLLVAAGALLATIVAYATLGVAATGGHGDTILAVELAGDGNDVWEGSSFWHALLWDVAFIGAYVACAVVAARALMPFYRVRLLRTKGATLVTSAAVAAGGLDLVENLFLAIGAAGSSRTGPDELFLLAAVFAISKFVVLAVVVALLAVAFVSGCSLRGWLFAAMYADATGTDSDDLQQGIGKEALKGFRPGVGICLSGGGVRAASLTLGCLQQLERNTDGTLDSTLGWATDKKITAVSGGAYMAGAWQLGRAYHPDAWRAEGPDGKVSPEEQHLLSNLGYLASTWSRGHRDELGAPSAPSESDEVVDRLRSGASVWATVFVGFTANLMVMLSALLLLVVVATTSLDWLAGLSGSCDLQEKAVFTDPCVVTQRRFWLPSVIWIVLGALGAALWVLVSKMRGLRRRVGVLKGFKNATRGMLGLGVVLGILLVGFPFLAQVVHRWDGRSAIGMVAGLSGTLGALVRLLVKRSAPLAAKLGGVAFVLLIVLMSGWLAVRVLEYSNRPTNGWFWLMVGGAVLVLVVAWCVGPELWSLNAFYRGKLRIAYAARRLAGDQKAVSFVNDADASLIMWTPPADLNRPLASGAVAAVAEPALHHLKGHTPLTICASAHVTTRGVASHYGIPAMSFTFSPDKVRTYVPQDDEGHFQVIHCATDDLQASYKGAGKLTSSRITTMFAVALAGAAVSPAMGRFRIGPTSALITFGNVRLGAWLPNPRYVRPGAARRMDRNDRFPKVRLSYLVKEFCGIHDPSDPYVYVSDGGHWENTGLVELLRGRTCHARWSPSTPILGTPAPCTSCRAPSTSLGSSAASRCTSTSTRSAASPTHQAVRCSRNARWPWE